MNSIPAIVSLRKAKQQLEQMICQNGVVLEEYRELPIASIYERVKQLVDDVNEMEKI